MMKKRIILLCMAVIIALCLSGCSPAKKLEFDVIYYEAMGYSENEDNTDKNAVFLLNQEDYEEMTNKYFPKSRLPADKLDKNKAVTVLFIPSESNTVSLYYVKSVILEDNTLTILIKKTLSEALVPRIPGPDTIYNWVLFIETDKSRLREDTEIEITLI